MQLWHRAIEEAEKRAGLGVAYTASSSSNSPIIAPQHATRLLRFKMLLHTPLCTRLEVDDLAFTELIMNGEVVYEAGNMPLALFIEEAYKRYEESPRAAVVGTLNDRDTEVRLLIYRGKAGIAVVSGFETASCIDVLDMYTHLRGTATISIVPYDIASEILEE